jgi:hypothetical protein
LPKAALVVSIDTEEEGRWTSSYPATGNTCRNISHLPRIHRIFERLGVIPTYLTDYPVAVDPQARDVIAGFLSDGRAEIGAHLHPWCNPPFDGAQAESGRVATYPHSLAPATQQAKLQQLCGVIEEGFGRRPTSYRAGRWGFDHTSVPVLENVGIKVDTSVNPLWWDPADSALVFVRAPLRPYRLDPEDVCSPGESNLVEVPTSGLVVGRRGPVVERLIRTIGPVRGLRRVWRKAGLGFLQPEEYGFEAMRQVVDAMAERGLNVYNVSFHSSVALPGATPYAADERELNHFCERLERILEHILERHQATSLALSDVPALLNGTSATS